MLKNFNTKFSKKDIILPQSFRVPLKVQDIANKILDRIPDDRRIKKQWEARKEVGDVDYITDIDASTTRR